MNLSAATVRRRHSPNATNKNGVEERRYSDELDYHYVLDLIGTIVDLLKTKRRFLKNRRKGKVTGLWGRGYWWLDLFTHCR